MSASVHSFSPKRGPRPQVVKRVAQALQKRLATGVYPVNTYLPSERQLADDLNAGRQSIAAAIRNLSELGLVERHPGRGSFIRPRIEKTISLIHTVFPGSSLVWVEATAVLQGARDRIVPGSMDLTEVDRLQWIKDPTLLSERTSGLLLIEIDQTIVDRVRSILMRGVPTVVANLEQDYSDVPASYIDHRAVVEQATRLLISMGHRRIGYVGNETNICFYSLARQGYTRALQEAAIPVDPGMIELRQGTMALAGFLGAQKLLAHANRPTAIVAARDGYAEGICQAIHDADLIVGRDVSVIGFDDMTWMDGREFLTTFAHPGAKLGQAAAEMLLEWVMSGERPPNRKLDAPIIMRRSVGPAPME